MRRVTILCVATIKQYAQVLCYIKLKQEGMTNNIKEFFDKMAPRWDEHSNPKPDILQQIIDYAQIKKDDRVIDVACGTGVLIPNLLNKLVSEIYAIDISEEMVKIARSKHKNNKLTIEEGDFTETQKTDYDHVIVHNAYPHFPDKFMLAKAIYKSLKVGGRFTIAHSISKEQVNGCHHKIENPISVKLEPAQIEAENFRGLFSIDTIKDTPDIYIISGVKK